MELTTEQNNLSIKNNPSIEDHYIEYQNFEKIWKIYPKKTNKSLAFKEYLIILDKYKTKGFTDTEVNRLIWNAVNTYSTQMQTENRETKFIKSGNNFFKSIDDYIDIIDLQGGEK